MSLSSPRTASTKCSSNSLKPDWEMRDWWNPKKGAKDVAPQGLLGEGGARKRAVPPKPPQFRWQSKPGKYRYKINALNSVSYYVWFFRKRKKKIFCGTFSLTLLLGRWECFLTLGFVDICISCIKWRKYLVMEIDGLGLQPERFFSWSLGSGRVKCQAVGRYIIQRAVRWPGPVHLIMASGLLLDNPAHSPSLLEISMLPVLPELNPCNQTDFKMVLLYVF